MLLPPTPLLSLEILLQTLLDQHLFRSYCITVISEEPLYFKINGTFTYISPSDPENLVNQILDVSENACSDYIVRMKQPENFMTAFEKVNHLGNVRRSDRKIVFLPPLEKDESDSNLLEVLSFKETRFVANILLVIPVKESLEDCDSYDLVTHRFVGRNEVTSRPHYLARWNSCSRKFDRTSNLFPHDISNLHGKVVRVAAFTYKPYVLLDLNDTEYALGRDGFEMRIVDEFCRWTNCTVEIVRDDANEWGEIYDNQTGVGVLGNVVEDKADLGITALYSWYEEYKVLDFSTSIIRTAVTCIAPSPRLLATWELPLLPFSWYMWLCLLCTFIYASIALMMAQRSTDKVFLTTFGMMITQSQHDSGATWRIRSITGWLLMTGLVLDNAYGGGLASTFTVPKYEQSVDTVQDIVDRKMEWGATHDAWIFSIMLSPEPLIKKLVSQFRVYNADELKRRSFTRSMAFSVEKLPAGYFAIGEYITKEATLDLTLMLEDFYYEQCVVMLRKSSPYTEKISEFVGRLHESGLMLAWETQVALKHLNFEVQLEVKLSRSKKDVDNAQALSLHHVVGIFIMYITGVIISILIFIVELFRQKTRKSQKRFSDSTM